MNYEVFQNNNETITSNIACTVLKVQEKKTQKGNSYAIVKFSDLTSVFELFIFSDVFETNRKLLYEGNSLIITLAKNFIDEAKTQKKINVKRIVSIKDFINKTIDNIVFDFSSVDELKKIKNISKVDGKTKVKIKLSIDNKKLTFDLKEKRKIDDNIINTLNLRENISVE